MKNIKKYLVALLLVLALIGCSANNDTPDNGDIVVDVPEGTEITFWHAMNGAQEEALTKITEDFMAANANIKVILQNQGSYGDMQAKINSTLISPKDLPTITQAYPNWLWNAAQDKLLVDLNPYITHAEIGLEDVDGIIDGLMDASVIEGVQYGIPFNKSTEVLYYNADILAQYGVEVPTTMEELKQASITIHEGSNGAVIGAGFDSLNNYYSIGLKNEGVDFTPEIDVTGDASKAVVSYYADGVRDGYFRIAGSDRYLSGPFGAQTIAMNIGSMAGESHVRNGADGQFEYGVANRPSEINLSQGTDIYMFTSATAEQKTAAFEYMKYLISEDAQLYWAIQTGYMPVRESVLNSSEYLDNEISKVPAIVGDATKNLFAIPVIANADPAYNLGATMMEKILSEIADGQDVDIDAELADFATQFEAAWNQ
ncbi:MAG: extracellular solute-binding protein [Erysipelothrix sp.]|nr:extracellular solute-binding protein [Erysipelothrix sp.]